MRKLSAFLFILFLFSCGEDENASLRDCWAMAGRDEKTQVFYRCGDERLTPSRFRETFSFKSNNKCEYLVLHQADAHYMEEGIYEYNPETSILIVKSTEGDQIVKFKIFSISAIEMKVQKLD